MRIVGGISKTAVKGGRDIVRIGTHILSGDCRRGFMQVHVRWWEGEMGMCAVSDLDAACSGGSGGLTKILTMCSVIGRDGKICEVRGGHPQHSCEGRMSLGLGLTPCPELVAAVSCKCSGGKER